MEEMYKTPTLRNQLESIGELKCELPNGENFYVKDTPAFSFVNSKLYELKTENRALNLIVNTLTAKEEKQEVKKDKWVSLTTRSGGDITIRVKDILYMNYDKTDNEYSLHIRTPEEDKVYVIRKESYKLLSELLVGNKEKENV